MPKNHLIGIGIDQGMANCGYALVKVDKSGQISVLEHGTIKTSSSYTHGKRLSTIYDTVKQLIKKHKASVMGCEQFFFNSKMAGGRNKSASMMQANMATGALHMLAEEAKIPVKDFVPGTVKKAVTGNGRATKEDMQEAILSLVQGREVKTEHEADAIGIGVTVVKYAQENPEFVYTHRKKPQKRKTTPKEKGEKQDE